MKNSNVPVYVLRELMESPNRVFTTKDLTYAIGCDRKTVYNAISVLECAGFHIEVKNRNEPINGCYRSNEYKWTGQVLGADV